MRRAGCAAPVLVALLLGGCGPQILAIEVLPPRTSATCAAPALSAAALGRGLLDVDATKELHGAYVGDLRISATGDVVIDGISANFVLPGDAGGDTTSAASDASGAQQLGDVLLIGEDDDVRQAIVEDVVLLPRALARALRQDSELAITDTEYITVGVELLATSGGEPIGDTPATFAIEACAGCLVEAPPAEDCPNGIADQSVCRPGQDKPLYGCAPPPSGSVFP